LVLGKGESLKKAVFARRTADEVSNTDTVIADATNDPSRRSHFHLNRCRIPLTGGTHLKML
jgi:hypothetical protein